MLAAGGKVFTLLDLGDVYMDVFLPTAEAGNTRLGAERASFSTPPRSAVPAQVVFVSGEAQFTPKMVETKAERDKLMFRVRVRVDPESLKAHSADPRAGQPGVAYVRLDPARPGPRSSSGAAIRSSDEFAVEVEGLVHGYASARRPRRDRRSISRPAAWSA